MLIPLFPNDSFFFPSLSSPVFPGLYMYMFSQRKKQLGTKRAPPPVVGIQWPVDAKGVRSSSLTGQTALAVSMVDADPNAAAACLRERNWRFGYGKHFVRNVELSCRDEATCLAIARKGLDHLHSTFEFVRGDRTLSLADAMREYTGSFADTVTITGKGVRMEEYVVPYRTAPYPRVSPLVDLKGEKLKEQLNKWVEKGSIEPSARDAIAAVVDHPEWRDLSDKYFVLLGAGSGAFSGIWGREGKGGDGRESEGEAQRRAVGWTLVEATWAEG